MQKGIMLKKCKKNKAYIICSSFASFLQCCGHISYRHAFFRLPFASLLSFSVSLPFILLFYSSLQYLFRVSLINFSSHLLLLLSPLHPSVSFPERHTPRLRRVSSAPCGALNSGTDFSFVGFHPSTPSLPDALKVIPAAYSFPRYGRGVVAAA